MKQINHWVLFGLLLASITQIAPQKALCDSETLFVQPVKSDLKAEPKMNAAPTQALKRGEAVQVLKKEGLWYQVSYSSKSGAKKTGWISKLFVNASRPIGEADLAKEMSNDENLNKSNRRRSSSYTTSASTRGLTAGNRVREGRDLYMSDSEAVGKMESIKIDGKEFQKFQEDGNLSR